MMCNVKVKWLLLASLTLSFISITETLKNVRCSIHPESVEVDPSHYRFYPIMVKLMRCRGSVGTNQPDVKRCVPIEVQNVTVPVYDEKTSKPGLKVVVNHTKCSSECVKKEKDCSRLERYDSKSCKCNCMYDSIPHPKFCDAPFVWSQSKCACECSYTASAQRCSYMKEWSHEHCQCRCRQKHFDICAQQFKAINVETCSCIQSPFVGIRNSTVMARAGDCNQVSKRMLAVALIIELLVLVIFFVMFYYYCLRDKNGSGDHKSKFAKFHLFNGKQKEISHSFDNRGDEEDEEQKLKIKTAYFEDKSDDSAIGTAVDRQELMEVDGSHPEYFSGRSPSTSANSSHCGLRTDNEFETTGDGWTVSPATMV